MNKFVIVALSSLALAGCSMLGKMGSMAGQAVQSGKESVASGKMAKDIGQGEQKMADSKKQSPHKKKIDKFVSSFESAVGRTFASQKKNKCSYYYSGGKRNAKSFTMGKALPTVYAKCYIENQYVEVYSYGTAKWQGTTAAQRVEKWFAKKHKDEGKWAVHKNMALQFDEVNEKTKSIKAKFLAANY